MTLRGALPYLIGGAVLLGGAAYSLSRQAAYRVSEGLRLEQEGKRIDAIEQYEWAIQSYTPFGKSPDLAIERLKAIAADAEIRGETKTALIAWQAIVSGLTVTQHFFQPRAEDLALAEGRLIELRNRFLTSASASPGAAAESIQPEDRAGE